MSGNCSTGSVFTAMRPARTMTVEMTADSTGRSINVFIFILLFSYDYFTIVDESNTF